MTLPEDVGLVVTRIFEGVHSDAMAGGEWDIEDAIDFTIEHMCSGDFEWHTRQEGNQKPKFDDTPDLEMLVREVLSRYYR